MTGCPVDAEEIRYAFYNTRVDLASQALKTGEWHKSL